MSEPRIVSISLGAGVQSTTMALMAMHGEIEPMPDCAIFADTGWEPAAVYSHLEWLESVLPFPVHRVSAGNIRADIMAGTNATGQTFAAAVPWHLRAPDGSEHLGRRQCTYHYKLKPIQRKLVQLIGGRPKGGGSVWIGISMDEVSRMKASKVQYLVNRWPLIERGMSRMDCRAWLDRRQYRQPPKSSCIGCPFHSAAHWRLLSKPEIADAIEVDRVIRHAPGTRGIQFMHRSFKPLEEVDLSTAEERGQADLFANDCEGGCGL